MKRALIAAMMLAALAVPAHAGPVTGNELHGLCAAKHDAESQGMCAGYIVGASDVWQVTTGIVEDILGASMNNHWSAYCPSKNYIRQQTIDIVAKYLEDHPEERSEAGITLVARALHAAWPCQE